jgi:predicted HAD superfamily Cof-like phosphohydrolase
MYRQYEQVKTFHTACGVEMVDTPTMLPKDMMSDRMSWILEELVETMKARTLEDQVDGLTDAMYFILGTFTLLGVNPEPIFDIVAEANLGKIGPDGTVLRDEQGKITKPAYWKHVFAPEPLIREELKRQGRVG